jgi:hypothetical protein
VRNRVIGLGVAAAIFLAAPVVAAEEPVRIRSITIEREDVFSEEEKLDDVFGLPDLTFIFDIANLLHLETREHVVRRELLFKEDEVVEPERIRESERNLRSLPFLRGVRILTKPVSPGVVDVFVFTRDTWTTEPRLSFSRGGGDSKEEYGIVEKNLFGLGKRIVLRYRSELDRSSNQFLYDDPRVLGSRFRFAGNYEDTSDGRVAQTLLDYPFYSLDTPWAGSMRYSSIRERQRIFGPGEEVLARFKHEQELIEGRVGGLIDNDEDRLVQRGGVFYRWLEDRFPGDAIGPEPDLEPTNRKESVPGVFYDRQVVDFVKERHLNLFDKVEDLNLGNVFHFEVGYSAQALGARYDEPIGYVSDRQGFDMGPGHKAFVYGLVTSRYQAGNVRNFVAEIEGISFNRVDLGYEHTFVTRLKFDFGKNLDRDTQLFLGNDNGLRGFENREFVGTRRFIFNLEDRVFFVNDLFHLVSLGMVVFFDSGYVWERGDDLHPRDVVASAGLGLRIGIPRAAGEKVFRVDLAIPLTSNGDRQFEPALSFGSGQAFSQFVGPFDLQTTSGD